MKVCCFGSDGREDELIRAKRLALVIVVGKEVQPVSKVGIGIKSWSTRQRVQVIMTAYDDD